MNRGIINIFLPLILLFSVQGFSQTSYEDSLKAFHASYVTNHGVVNGPDKNHLAFYEVNKAYRVSADFVPADSLQWISLKTTGTRPKVFKLYGRLLFQINKEPCRLSIYQSQDLMNNDAYKNYLFLPFTDASNGTETYEGGRYIDLTTADIVNNKMVLDFNKTYNPYCAYVGGIYNCPIPPIENKLKIAIKAGEKSFTKAH